jgi:hypothetical protein
MAVHTPDELRDLLTTVITGVTGGSDTQWRQAIGPVTKLPISTNARCNWRVSPRGSAAELGVIRHAVEIVRAAHPYVTG